MLLALLAFISLVSGAPNEEGTALDRKCSQQELVSCAYPVDIEKFRLVSNKEELDNLCLNINKGLRCIDNYTRNCLHPHQRSHFNKLYSGTTMVMQELCQEGGEYRNEYLKHAPCMKNAHKDYEQCAHNYEENFKNVQDNSNANDFQIKNLCCSLSEYLQCSKDSVMKTCGPSTASFASGFLDKMASNLIQDYCKSFISGEGRCVSAASLTTYSQLLLVLIILSYTIYK